MHKMEIKSEPEDCYNFAESNKTLNTHSSTIRIKTEDSNSGITSPVFNPELNQPFVLYIKQEECKANYENVPTYDVNLTKSFPICGGVIKQKRFSCSLCKYGSDRRRDLLVHLETHKKINYFKCTKCGLKMNHPRNVSVNTGNVPFKCDSCSYKPPKKNSGKITTAKYFYCHSCGFKAAGMSRFQMLHELVCNKVEKPFTCPSCDYKCVTQSALTDHLVTHVGGNPFPCSICYYRTNSQVNLEAHMISHKPFFCITCEYRCGTQATLNKHLKTHGKGEDQPESVGEKEILKIYKSSGLKQLQTVKTEEVCINVDF